MLLWYNNGPKYSYQGSNFMICTKYYLKLFSLLPYFAKIL